MIKFQNSDLFLVAGGSSGLGKAICYKINELGGSVVAIARNTEKLLSAKKGSSNPDLFFIESKDLTTEIDNLPLWLVSLAEKYGKFRGYVHSAGIQETLPLSSTKVEKAKVLFDINLFSALSLCKGFAKKSVNTGQGSSIVLISSFVSNLGLAATVSYSASKGALNSAMKVMAVELARDGIRVNSILPGHVVTELFSNDAKVSSENFVNSLKQKYPLGLGKPEDIANLSCFLLSNSSSWITGSEIVIDGGASIMF